MKKYIKFYDANAHKNIRFSARGITVESKLHADCIEVRFVNKSTHRIPLAICLCVVDKELEDLCKNMLDTKLNVVVELLVQQMVTDDLLTFLDNSHTSMPIIVYSQKWVQIYNSFLLKIYKNEGKGIKKLADDCRKVFN